MKILVINWQDRKNPLSGGAEVHLHQIFGRIARWGNDVTLLCSSFNNAPKNEVVDGMKLIRIGRRDTFNFYVPSACITLLRSKKYDIVIDNINKIPFFTPLYVKLPLLVVAYHFFGRAIYEETNLLFASYVYLTETMVPKIYKKEVFSVLSESTKDELVRWGVPNNHIYIVSPAISSEVTSDFRLKSPDPLIISLGRIKKYKCLDNLLFAMRDVLSRIPEARLTIIGTGDYLPNLVRLTEKLNLTNSVKFTGFISEQEKRRILQTAWVVANTSIKEGWGITNIEANACGTPVVASDSPGLRDSVVDGKTGFLVRHGDVGALSNKIIEILQDKTLRERLSQNAIQWASQFSWDRSAKDMLALIEYVVKYYPSRNRAGFAVSPQMESRVSSQ
ncbi:glycosyltransferase family 4 protein [candidate division WOR-3 bacterium]|nr:glycosyltransferase family 4 protein [candidate division WOR-3 bacterium]